MSVPRQKPQYAALTDIGLVRSENQDSYGVYDGWDEAPGKGLLVLVADGMGGEAGGATASRMAVEIVMEHYKSSASDDPSGLLREGFQIAAESIFKETEKDPTLAGMGTTCTALAVVGDLGYLAHIGDSRAYRIRDESIEQLSVDQTWVQEMVNRGHITEAEAKVHPQRNVLTQALGSERAPEPLVRAEPLQLAGGDLFVLCSDGLPGLVTDDEILQLATGSADMNEACANLVEAARSRGGHDNITVLLVRIPPA